MTTARRLPGGEVVILWEAQASPLGLHSKQWLAHRNEFLPETKSKSISKVTKIRQCATSYEGAPIWNTPHGLGYRGWIRGTRLLCTLHGCPLAPAIQVIDVHFNCSVARFTATRSAAQGSLPCRCRITCHSITKDSTL